MTQYARPNSDGGDAEWVKQNGASGALNRLIDESSTDDSDYMKSTHAGASDEATRNWCMIILKSMQNERSEAGKRINGY